MEENGDTFHSMEYLKENFKNNKRMGVFSLAILFYWIKTMVAYYTGFSLGVTGVTETLENLIKQLKTQNYPKQNYTIFVKQ